MQKIKTLRTTKFLAYLLVGAFLFYLNVLEISYAQTPSPENTIEEGKVLFEQGDYEHSLQKLTEAEAFFTNSQPKSRTEKLAEISFYQGLNFARQGNEEIARAHFKRALKYAPERAYDTSLMDEATAEIFTQARIECEQEFNPKAMGLEAEGGSSGSSAAWIALAIIAVAAIGVLAYLLLTKEEKKEEPNEGSIQVNSTPTGASIWLDGADTGKVTNATLTGIAVGTHTIKLVLSGYQNYQTTVNVTKGSTAVVNATMVTDVGKIKVNSTPTGAAIWLDGSATGKTTNATLNDVPVGSHTVKVVKDRYQDQQKTVNVNKNATTTVNFTLEVGDFTEDFNDNQAQYFKGVGGNWSCSGGRYRFQGQSPTGVHSRSFYQLGKYKNCTIEAIFNRVATSGNAGVYGLIFRGGGTDCKDYYLLDINPRDGNYAVFKDINDSVAATLINWTNHPAIITGLNQWNKLRVVASGSNFSIYINDQFINSFSDSSFSKGYVGLWCYGYTGSDEVLFDDFTVTLTTSGSVPGKRIIPRPSKPGDQIGK